MFRIVITNNYSNHLVVIISLTTFTLVVAVVVVALKFVIDAIVGIAVVISFGKISIASE